MSWTYEKRKERFLNNLNSLSNDFELVDEFIDVQTKINFLHKPCNNIIPIKPTNLLEGLKKGRNCCKECTKKDLSYTYEEVKAYIENEGYELISKDYKNNKTKLKIKCKNENCPKGYFEMIFNDFKNKGHRCIYCAGKYKFDIKYLKNQTINLTNSEYSLLSKNYEGVDHKLEFKHNTCQKIFLMDWNHFSRGQRCPYCKSSKGEKKVAEVLDLLNIKYEKEKTFEDCKFKSLLRFDFYFKLGNKEYIIEYDGEQHFLEHRSFFKNTEEFISLQRRDKIKNDYCLEKGINLLRISYLEFYNIEEIIKNYIEDQRLLCTL